VSLRRSRAVLVAAALVVVAAPASGAVADDPPATLPVEDLTLPVEDLTLPVEDLVFSEGSLDGALTDTGHREFRLAADVLFAFDQATLTPKAAALLAQVATTLKAQGAARATVTGFTDSTGPDAYNLDLSRRRAQAVVAALQPQVGPAVTLTADGRGEAGPIADNSTAAGQALNRRVEIRVG
jgi:outer membrane protein OmpA-like peptidoglycan-associated protein